MIELLAPAGSREALIAAVEAGADAVYLSGNQFGARAYAANFDEEGLRDAIRFAHLRGVHVHVTVNTMVLDEELDALRRYLQFLERSGADAALIQDLGVARLARQCAPLLPLHASTQMTIHNIAGAKAMEALGFSRVVLSRELSFAEIREIVRHTNLEIEVFMHGALCVCYSGQCLMSSLIGGRSGNRGRCAQPCRLPYTLVDEEGSDVLSDTAGKFLLSPKDLNTLDVLPQLVAAGVSSLKIEGRMKKPEYVATVVRTYRAVLDRILAGQETEPTGEERSNLSQIFNRDFTTAYLLDRPGRTMMSDRKPNNRGRLAGRVLAYDKVAGRVTLHLASDLHAEDDLDFWVKVGGRVNTRVHDMRDASGRPIDHAEAGEDITLPLPRPVKVHDRVFKIYDTALMAAAKRYYTSGAPIRRIPVDVTAVARIGKPLTITMTDADGHYVEAATEFFGEPAKKRPLTEEILKKQIDRLGTSIFTLRHFQATIDEAVMFPVSEINKARQKAVELLEAARLRDFDRATSERADREATANSCPPPRGGADREAVEGVSEVRHTNPHDRNLRGNAKPTTKLLISVDTLKAALAAYAAGADVILFGGDSYHHAQLTPHHYEEAAKLAEEFHKPIYFNTPRIVRDEHLPQTIAILDAARKLHPAAIYVQSLALLYYVKERDLPIHTGTSIVCANRETLAFLASQGASAATLSPELTLEQVKTLAKLSPIPLTCLVHGPIELMVSEYCTLGSYLGAGKGQGAAKTGVPHCSMPCTRGHYALRDRKGIDFPIACDQFCHMHILNSRPLSMLPHLHALKRAGITHLRIEGRAYEPEELANIVKAYRRVLAMTETECSEHAEDIATWEGKNFTRGHYFRGVASDAQAPLATLWN